MRFMVLVRATPESEAGVVPDASALEAMAGFHQRLAEAGMLVDAAGLKPSAAGWRIHYAGERQTLVEGPFDGAEALVAGYTIIRADSREEVLEWLRCWPHPAGPGRDAVVEVRQLYELDDFVPDEGLEGTLVFEVARLH
jgi:hypothetical protein